MGVWRVWLLSVLVAAPALAHHGGLGIEGDLVEWALRVDQWQEEQLDQGYRIKFLSYPRQPLRGERTRLVFEVQEVASGQYVGGLAATLALRAPDGRQITLPLPENQGVLAYYETAFVFAQAGEYELTFQATGTTGPFRGTFRKTVRPTALLGDWATLLGNATVLAALTLTWVGFLLSLQRRLVPPHRPDETASP